ncbi:MAG TPA: thermonuclease family protein [Pyrinomonadaceae bacterium]
MCDAVSAASLFGRVIEINGGDVVTVFNLNRPVRVRLLGVDAPEMNQAFGEVARKHLSDLVYDKSVIVEYSGIGADSSLTGRVLLNNTDVGAQMIRDGAAWVDINSSSRLNASDREVYEQSEHAARGERRGLWQAENPVAPWEFVKNEALRKNPVAQLNAISPPKTARADRPIPELTNLTLMSSRLANPAGLDPARKAELAKLMGGPSKSWFRFRPEGQNFSILAPADGDYDLMPEAPNDQFVDSHSYIARDGWVGYVVAWMKTPTKGRTEESALEEASIGFLRSAHRDSGRGDSLQQFPCEPGPGKNISMNGYAGKEFDLSSCPLPFKARVYVRKNGNYLHFYMAAAAYLQEDENVDRFLESFTIGSPQKTKSRKQ